MCSDVISSEKLIDQLGPAMSRQGVARQTPSRNPNDKPAATTSPNASVRSVPSHAHGPSALKQERTAGAPNERARDRLVKDYEEICRTRTSAKPNTASLPASEIFLPIMDAIRRTALPFSRPAGASLTYGALRARTNEIVRELRDFGIGGSDRVAVVLPGGPEAAVATIAVAAGAVCVPLHPGFAAEEWRRYFGDLRVAALLTRAEVDSASRGVAYSLGIPVIDLSPRPGEGPAHSALFARRRERAVVGELATGADDAFMLLTSGTTSRPKLVPLTHASVCLSAYNVGAALALEVSRPVTECSAAVSWAWPDLGTVGCVGSRVECCMPARLRCRGFLRLADEVSTHLVHGSPANPSSADIGSTSPQARPPGSHPCDLSDPPLRPCRPTCSTSWRGFLASP